MAAVLWITPHAVVVGHAQAKTITEEMGIYFLGLGFDPISTHDEVPVMPKQRYGLMRNYMPKRGSLGLDMMFRSCTIQVVDISPDDVVMLYACERFNPHPCVYFIVTHLTFMIAYAKIPITREDHRLVRHVIISSSCLSSSSSGQPGL